jgi:hypothetical protein
MGGQAIYTLFFSVTSHVKWGENNPRLIVIIICIVCCYILDLIIVLADLNFFLFGDIGGWTQGLVVAIQALYYLSRSPSPFCIGCFWDRVHFVPWPAWTMILFVLPCVAAPPHPATGWNGVSWTFCLGRPWMEMLWISASQVARIIGMYCHAQLV